MSQATPSSGFWQTVRRSIGSRHRAAEILKTLVVVVPLTLLIWIYAERSQLKPGSAQVSVVLAPARQTLAPTEPLGLSLDFEGPQNQLTQLKEELSKRTATGQLRVSLPEIYDAGDNTIDTKLLLSNDPFFASYGVQIMKVTPPIVRVHLDPLKRKSLTVVMPADVPATVQQVKFNPPTVVVTGPESKINEEYRNGTISIDDSGLKQAMATPGRHTEQSVPLVMPRDGRSTVSTPRVDVEFEVTSDDKEVTVPTVFIDVQQPLAQQGKWAVRLGQQVLQNVRLRGPKAIVEKYERLDEPLTAVLRVKQDDIAAGGATARQLVFLDLPAGVTVTSGPYSVSFTLEAISR